VTPPLLIGWKEVVAFPEWGLRRLRVKVDTGAYSSALDVEGYDLEERGGAAVARVRLVLNRKKPGRVRVVEAPVLGFTRVVCSNGVCEQRPVVAALVRLGALEKRVRLTLTRHRASLRHRMLLGREALNGTFVVDPSRKYLLGR
jgi:hypothetical protein